MQSMDKRRPGDENRSEYQIQRGVNAAWEVGELSRKYKTHLIEAEELQKKITQLLEDYPEPQIFALSLRELYNMLSNFPEMDELRLVVLNRFWSAGITALA